MERTTSHLLFLKFTHFEPAAADKLMKNWAGSAINKERQNEVLSPCSDEKKMGGVRVFEIRAAESTFGVCYKCLTPFLTVSNSWGKGGHSDSLIKEEENTELNIGTIIHGCTSQFPWYLFDSDFLERYDQSFSLKGQQCFKVPCLNHSTFFVVEHTQKPWFWLLWKYKHWN